MNLFSLGSSFWRFPTDNFGHWLLVGALVYSIILLTFVGIRDEMRIAEGKSLPKTGAARLLTYAGGVIIFLAGIAHGACSVSLFYFVLIVPTAIIMLTLAGSIHKEEMKLAESDELINTRDNDKNDPSRLIQ